MASALEFESELALQRTLCAGMDRLALPAAGLRHAVVRREVPIGSRIADFVVVRFAELPSDLDWSIRWSFRHAYVVSLLRRREALRIATIAAHAFEEPSRIEPLVSELINCGALCQTSSGAVRLSPWLASIRAQVITVEAKLHRWKEALEQAVYNAAFADFSVVAMDAGGSPRSPAALDQFRKNGIGLCAVGSQAADWLVAPQPFTAGRSPEWDYLVSAAANQHLSHTMVAAE